MLIAKKLKRVLLLTFIPIGLTGFAYAQPALPIPDELGNYWNINGSSILKINFLGETVASYSNLSLGKPFSIDASDPFRILAFFRESQFMVILNSNATPIGKPINFLDHNPGDVPLICRSLRGGFWIYDYQGKGLVHFDDQMKRTGFRILLNESTQNQTPNFLIEHNGIIYLGLNGERIACFDVYGSELKSFDIRFNDVRFSGNNLWYRDNAIIYKIKLGDVTSNPEKILTPCATIPLADGEDIVCFDGEKFSLFIKNE